MNAYRQLQSYPTPVIFQQFMGEQALKAYGSIWFEDNTVATTAIGATNVPIAPPVGGYSVSPAIGTTPGAAGLTIDKAGIYFVTFAASFTGANANVVFDFYIDASGTEINPGTHVKNANTTDSRSMSICWILQLAAGTVLRPVVHAETGSGRTLTVEDCALCALYVGDL